MLTFTDKQLLNLFAHTRFAVVKQFVIALLQSRQSTALEQKKELFLHDKQFFIQYHRAVGDHKSASGATDVNILNVEFIWDSQSIMGLEKSNLIKQIEQIYSTQKQFPHIARILYKSLLNNPKIKSDFIKIGDQFDLKPFSEQSKIVGLLMLKEVNAASVDFIRYVFEYTDEVVLSLKSLTYEYGLLKEFGKEIHIIDQPVIFHDSLVYEQLFSKAREISGTHFLRIDEDERMDPELTPKKLRNMVNKMSVGDVLCAPFQHLYGKDAGFLVNFNAFDVFSLSRLTEPFKDFIYCDDKVSKQGGLGFHCPWVPPTHINKRYIIETGLVHYDLVDIQKNKNKMMRYPFWDYSIMSNSDVLMDRYLSPCFRNFLIKKNSEFLNVNTKEIDESLVKSTRKLTKNANFHELCKEYPNTHPMALEIIQFLHKAYV